jgi:hypothetical protein
MTELKNIMIRNLSEEDKIAINKAKEETGCKQASKAIIAVTRSYYRMVKHYERMKEDNRRLIEENKRLTQAAQLIRQGNTIIDDILNKNK